MAKTCIICGGPAGSAEHVFPASLGGRRTNNGIYCEPHNKAYSPLADLLKEQLSIFNAPLGVIKEHTKEESEVTVTEVATGRAATMAASGMRFQAPQILSEERREDGSVVIEQAFSTQAEADAWVAAERAQGREIRIIGPARRDEYFPGTVHHQIALGGTEKGMRSIAYIAQTFLAQAFPDLARSPQLQALKDYTLHNTGAGFVWWEFDPPNDVPASPFAFGHRVIVGHDSADGAVYARVSLFGSLNYALLLARVPSDTSRAVMTDIDPLALRAPADTQKQEFAKAVSAVIRPADPIQILGDALRTGRAEQEINKLVGRIQEFELNKTAGELMGTVAAASIKPEAERRADLTQVVAGQSQRLLVIMRKSAADMKSSWAGAGGQMVSSLLEAALRQDPASANGLSPEAIRSLELVRPVLVEQMDRDLVGGRLDQDRLAMLIGGGPGAAIMLEALIPNLVRRAASGQRT